MSKQVVTHGDRLCLQSAACDSGIGSRHSLRFPGVLMAQATPIESSFYTMVRAVAFWAGDAAKVWIVRYQGSGSTADERSEPRDYSEKFPALSALLFLEIPQSITNSRHGAKVQHSQSIDIGKDRGDQ